MMKRGKSPLVKPTAGAMILASVFVRLVPHIPNMTPLGATAIFGGKKIGRPWNYLLPLGILFLTDLFLGFHKTMIFVYLSFALTVFISERVKRSDYLTVGGTAVLSSIIFFLITNFGSWQVGTMYTHNLQGLMQSYVMGLPFLGSMLAGDIVYSLGFFAVYNYLTKTEIAQKFDNKILAWIN